jgi:hypothetical protein
MKSKLTKKRTIIAISAIAVLVVAGSAFAYFTSTGNGTGQATVGSASNWTVTPAAATGTMYPGAGTSTIAYTITNASTGHQKLAATTALVNADTNGYITANGVSVTGCLATWFTANNHSPAAADLAGAATTTGSVDVTMTDAAVAQDTCQGHTPDVKISVT